MYRRLNLGTDPSDRVEFALAVIEASGGRPQESVSVGMSSVEVLIVDSRARVRRMFR
jgi:hypothetical protein